MALREHEKILELHGMPGHLIRRMNQIAVSLFMDEVGKVGFDLTPVQYATLVAVAENPGIDQATVAGMVAYDRVTIGGVVDRLVQKAFISRKVSVRDRRARELFITPDGETAIAKITPVVRETQVLMLNGLSDQEKAVFVSLLKKAADGANDLSRAPLRLAL